MLLIFNKLLESDKRLTLNVVSDLMLCIVHATVHYTQVSPPTSWTVSLYLLYTTPTCFGHISKSSSGSYKFPRSVHVLAYTLHISSKLPEDIRDVWPKHVGVVYDKYKNAVQLAGDEICVCGFRFSWWFYRSQLGTWSLYCVYVQGHYCIFQLSLVASCWLGYTMHTNTHTGWLSHCLQNSVRVICLFWACAMTHTENTQDTRSVV